MIKTIALVVLAAIGVLLAFAAAQPDTFKVQRSASIKAPPDKLHGLINDMKVFNTWNPYNLKDPNIKGEYQGPQAGPGAAYHFTGNKDVGKGSVTITDSAPSKVTMKLDMIEPFEGHNVVEFILAPKGDSTEVTWAMHGPSPYIGKVMGLVFNMDSMIGRDFEAGLANLKAKAER
ncbi:SRPBCC family protein [Ramlibacter sp. WS9]|uniref:SRPBCC family protein n=1 Tax=Ramlibacter sp. WS9 TaxID=1882741 RepID=UPI00114347CA|nr:SRPBCC family protein [Ramlibacter sp. WS9]ROZ77410.1 polyketide cyclase [Ramlibacter sp. WS9]